MYIKMDLPITDNGWEMREMVLENSSIQTGIITKENGGMTKDTAKESTKVLWAIIIKEIIEITKRMVWAN